MTDLFPTLRIARPTNSIDALLPFYRDGLGFKVLTRFDDHDGFSGAILGHPGAPWHLEFTWHDSHSAPSCPTEDHLIAVYLPELEIWQAACARMAAAGFAPVAAFNPYWEQLGRTYEDAEGYRVVLQQQGWTF